MISARCTEQPRADTPEVNELPQARQGMNFDLPTTSIMTSVNAQEDPVACSANLVSILRRGFAADKAPSNRGWPTPVMFLLQLHGVSSTELGYIGCVVQATDRQRPIILEHEVTSLEKVNQ